MMILKEFACMAHGDFDGFEAVCPKGCKGDGMVQRAFRTPPSIRSSSYGGINKTFDSLASEHGLSNMSNRDGQGMRRADYATHERLRKTSEMILNSGDRSGQDMGQYFRPVTEMGAVRAPQNIRKSDTRTVFDANGQAFTYGTGKTIVGEGTVLSSPAARVESSYDGRSAGLPSSDK